MTPEDKMAAAQALLNDAHAQLDLALSKERGRARGQLNHQLWDIERRSGNIPEYFSQSGQDRYIDSVLMTRKTNGVFVDIGGYDGVTGSNSLFFEVFRNWSGLLVEPVSDNLMKAKQVRHCKCLSCGVADAAGTKPFIEVATGYSQMSGFLDSYDAGLLNQVRAHPDHSENTVMIETRTLADILDAEGLAKVDYLSLDVEGAELSIIDDFPFERFEIEVWSIENNLANPEIPRRMAHAGYQLVEFIGVDEIYARTSPVP